MTGQRAMTVVNQPVPIGTHICAFYSGPASRDELVMPFLAEGIRAGQKCICILESLSPAEVLARLGREVDLDRSVETGQLELATPADAYLRTGTFSIDDMLSYWEQAVAEARGADGTGMLRAAGEMPSALDHPDGRMEFSRYEARITAFAADLPAVLLCLYDLQRFGADVLVDSLRTHPMVVVDGGVHDNPYYIDPGAFLRGME